MTAPRLVSTFSIVAREPATGSLGVAVQSRAFNVGAIVPWAEAGVGAVATQAFAEIGYGPRALARLRGGARAADVLASLLADDPQAALRQVAVLDAGGGCAAHTGEACIPSAGHRIGAGYSVQGNLLASDGVPDAMAAAFERAPGSLAPRLVAALRAGQRAGGDARGRESAALLVVQPVSASEPWRNRVVDLRVEHHRHPIEELARLLEIHRAFTLVSEARTALVAGRRDEARALADQALRNRARHDEVPFWIGIQRAVEGDEDGAVAALRTALRRNPRWRRVLPRLPGFLRPGDAVLRRLLHRQERRLPRARRTARPRGSEPPTRRAPSAPAARSLIPGNALSGAVRRSALPGVNPLAGWRVLQAKLQRRAPMTRKCPWCAEEIQAEAIKCRYCGSRVSGGLRDPSEWHRGHPDKRVAGVCAAIAHHLAVSVTAVRAAFLLLTLVHGFGLIAYVALWFVLPPRPGGRSGLDRVIDAGRTLIGGEPRRGPPPAGTPRPADGPSDREGSSGGWTPTRS